MTVTGMNRPRLLHGVLLSHADLGTLSGSRTVVSEPGDGLIYTPSPANVTVFNHASFNINCVLVHL